MITTISVYVTLNPMHGLLSYLMYLEYYITATICCITRMLSTPCHSITTLHW